MKYFLSGLVNNLLDDAIDSIDRFDKHLNDNVDILYNKRDLYLGKSHNIKNNENHIYIPGTTNPTYSYIITNKKYKLSNTPIITNKKYKSSSIPIITNKKYILPNIVKPYYENNNYNVSSYNKSKYYSYYNINHDGDKYYNYNINRYRNTHNDYKHRNDIIIYKKNTNNTKYNTDRYIGKYHRYIY